MTIGIKVQYSRNELLDSLQSYDLKVEVVQATDMPEKVFIFQRGVVPAHTLDADPADTFVCVADPVDLENVPADNPDIGDEMPYFRLGEVTLRFRNLEDLEEVQLLIDEDISGLVGSMRAAENVDLFAEAIYGVLTPTGTTGATSP